MAKKTKADLGKFFGKLYSFNVSLKVYHWHVTGPGSYAQHIALDQAIESVTDVLDRIVETSYALKGDIKIVVPETSVPEDIIKYCKEFYEYIHESRKLFEDINFQDSILDDYQEAIQQLLYRLIRLK